MDNFVNNTPTSVRYVLAGLVGVALMFGLASCKSAKEICQENGNAWLEETEQCYTVDTPEG